MALLDEYPRWLKKEHEISGEIKSAVPISATYTLEESELRSIEEKFGVGVLKQADVQISRNYTDDKFQISTDIDYKRFIGLFLDEHASASIRDQLSSAQTSTQLVELLDRLALQVSAPSEPTADAQAAKETRKKLDAVLHGSPSLRVAIEEAIIRPLVPKTFYFSHYSQLRGRYRLAELLPALKTPTDDEEVQAAADLLRQARVSAKEMESEDFERSNSELEAISSLLTRRVKQNWKQNEHLKLEIKIESGVDQGAPAKFLQIRVRDARHDFTSRLDRRSTGFQWFVSFMASFLEFEQDKSLILLLDEPGLSLHARAQIDLLDTVDRYLSKSRQVLYTTHSPFMVRTANLERVRIVEDQGPDRGSVVSNEAGVCSDPDTLFPLQAALGYDIAHNLFIGNRNILVEGTSDFIYLSALSSHLAAKGRASIPENARIMPAGGATNIPTFLALLGEHLDVVVVLDGDAPRQKIDNAIAQDRLSKERVLSLENFATVKGADIEDLFTPSEYLALFNATFSKSYSVTDLPGNDRIVKRIERKHGSEFDHGRVAGYFLANQPTILPGLQPETLDRFDSLIRAISLALPPK